MDYLKKAEELLKSYGKITPCFEEIGEVAGAMIKANIDFDGRGIRSKFITCQGIYKVRNILTKRKKRQYFEDIHTYDHPGGEDPAEILYIKEVVKILKKSKRYSMIEDRFFNSMTLQEIGDKNGITRERVRQIINEEMSNARKILADM